MAEIVHKDTPPEKYELTEIDHEFVAECPFCDFITDPPEKKKEPARVRLAMHILDEQKTELAAPE